MKRRLCAGLCACFLLMLPACTYADGLLSSIAHFTTASTAADTAAVSPSRGCYAYDALDAVQQENYDSVYAALERTRTADEDLSAWLEDTVETDEPTVGVRVLLPQPLKDTSALLTLYRAMLDDHPEFFYIDNYAYEYTVDQNGDSTYFSLMLFFFMPADERTAAASTLSETVAALTADLKEAGLSDYEKELTLHDRLLARCTYDTETAESEENGDPQSHSAYGALCGGRAVCDGYTRAMLLLLREVGLRTAAVYNDDHVWNVVWVDGEPYHLDATWDDSAEIPLHSYFNLTDEQVMRSHTLPTQTPPLPACTAVSANFFVRNGTVLTSSDSRLIADTVLAQWRLGCDTVELYFEGDSYESACEQLAQQHIFDNLQDELDETIREDWALYSYIYDDQAHTIALYR